MKLVSVVVGCLFSVALLGSEVKSSFSPEDFSHTLRTIESRHLELDFDTDYWSGYLSFELEAVFHHSETIDVEVHDANGKVWRVSNSSPVKTKYFKRLKTPVRIYASDVDYSNHLKFSKVLLEFTKMPFYSTKGSGKFGFEKQQIFHFAPYLFGNAEVRAEARFYDNYESGTSCSRLSFKGADGNSFDLTDQRTVRSHVKLSMPFQVYENPICHSSDLRNPENSEIDYEYSLRITSFNEAGQ